MAIEHQNAATVNASLTKGMNPGMQLRLEQKTLDAFQLAMADFLPKYVNTDLNLPTEYHYEFGLFLEILSYEIDWTNITYTKIDLDV